MIYGQNKQIICQIIYNINKSMISRIFIFLIVFTLFQNVYAKHDTTEMEVKMKGEQKNSKRNSEEINEKLDNLTSLVEENQNQIRLLSCWANPVKYIENKIYWISNSSFDHNYTLKGGWTFGNYNRRTVI